mgnify:CR=1 FL=1
MLSRWSSSSSSSLLLSMMNLWREKRLIGPLEMDEKNLSKLYSSCMYVPRIWYIYRSSCIAIIDQFFFLSSWMYWKILMIFEHSFLSVFQLFLLTLIVFFWMKTIAAANKTGKVSKNVLIKRWTLKMSEQLRNN